MYCDVSFVEDPLENERVHLKGFILSTFEITKYIKFIGKYIKHAGLGCIWNMCCQLFSWWARVSPECASSYLSSTKLRPLTQPTSQTCAPHTYHQKGHTPIVWVKVFQLFLCVKRKNLKVSRKKTLTSLGRKEEPERRLWAGIWYIPPLIFSFFFLPQTMARVNGFPSQTHTRRYFLLGVRGGQTVLWMTDWALKWAPFFLMQRSCFSFLFSSFHCCPTLFSRGDHELFVI